ncbi:hypothetical protein B0H67DRAFT_639324 [Lasiosphaeris hirsuta]|uniref:Zonadhesin n=1 Tax=Lasiosphaeris hirsuta TaxID=260670 RepID=A0AA40BAV8_9PEZI|nr:hypothetical protein B0H67DRAFT_639324 [Lasiosphaeris hirsuta]
MQQSFAPPQARDQREAYGYYEYNPQATEDHEEHDDHGRDHNANEHNDALADHEEEDAEVRKKSSMPVLLGRPPNYKPTPLRWPFITVVIILLFIAIGLVVYAKKAMPNSEGDAIILGLNPTATTGDSPTAGPTQRRFARAAVVNASTPVSVDALSSTANVASSVVLTTIPSSDVVATTSLPTSPGTATISPSLVGSLPHSSHLSDVSATGGTDSASGSTSAPVSASTSTGSFPATNSETSSTGVSNSGTSSGTSSGGAANTGTTRTPSSRVTPSLTTLTGISETITLTIDPSVTGTGTNTDFNYNKNAASNTTTMLVPTGTSVRLTTFNVTMPESTTTFISTVTSVHLTTVLTESTFLTTVVSSSFTVFPTSFQGLLPPGFTFNGTFPPPPPPPTTSSGGGPEPSGGPAGTTVFYEFTTVFSSVTTVSSVSSATTVFESAVVSTLPATIIPEVGPVTVTYYETIVPTHNGPATVEQPATQLPNKPDAPKNGDPVQVTNIQIVDGTTVGVLKTQAPTVVVVGANEQVVTQVERPVETGVVQVGGTVVTNYVVITPSPGVAVERVATVGGTPVTVVKNADPVTVETVIGGVRQTVVQTPPPQTIVSVAGGTVTTIKDFVAPAAAGQGVTYTLVSNAGGTPVTQVVVTTPVGPPYQPISYTVVKDVGGTKVTEVVVTTPPPGQAFSYTVVSTVGGTPVTQVVVATPTGAPFQPVSYTTVRNVGGTPTVITITPPPTSFVTTINGTPVTVVTQPPVTSFTSTVGGSLTTEIVVTTPSGTGLITLTFVSTSGGTLSSYTSTLSPTTFVTTISGKLTTITSTPSASTSFSTRKPSTRTLTSTSTPSSSPTGGISALPTVVASTKVYTWTHADIFVGTFLPPLLGVGLVILLRVIDLNAKLYQPFQSLAQAGGAQGAESLTMQYTGLMAFITPVVTLLQGHPVPFITTLMVGCASFIVPLATEAIGLKLHGYCYLNTASQQCGPSLGISPVPANALIGLISAVIVLLLLILFFMRRWATGLNANPWSIAGIASLSGSTQVRIRQSSQQAIKRAVSQKQYGLGWFQNALGRNEYGIILMDESGRGLHDHGEIDSDSDGLSSTGAAEGPQTLPFMTLRHPWRISLILFELAVLIFIIYYHVYYHGKVSDGGRLWGAMNSNSFGVRFISAIIGVIIAFCWQSFFLGVSVMTPYQLMATRTQPAARSILLSLSTNPFSGIYAAVKQRHLFFFATSLAAILSEFLPVLLSNVPFSLSQTGVTATVCTAMSGLFLSIHIAVLIASFFIRYPPMPVDPRSVAGAMYYVSQSHMLTSDFDGVSQLDAEDRDRRVKESGRRYFYGVLVGGTWRRMGVDYDLGPSDEVVTTYRGARSDEAPAMDSHDYRNI